MAAHPSVWRRRTAALFCWGRAAPARYARARHALDFSHATVRDICRLIEIMAALRTPGTGCPWDLEQDFATIAPYTLEEAYEVADAIARNDLVDLRDELGDLLLQVVFHARMAEEQGAFDFGGVVQAITEKMIRRHPHVFGDDRARGAGMAKGMWDAIKARRRRRSAQPGSPRAETPEDHGSGYLDGVPVAHPALTRALKLAGEGGKGRLRLEGRQADPRQDRGGNRRAQGGDGAAARTAAYRGRVRRRAVRAGQFRPAPEDRSGEGVARHQREIPLAPARGPAFARGEAAAAWKPRALTRWKRSGSAQKPRSSTGLLPQNAAD